MSVVFYRQENFVGIVTIERPEALNALNSEVLGELNQVFANIDLETTRVVLLTGSGTKSFVAGADISEMMPLNRSQGAKFSNKGNEIFRKIENFPIPVIAVVNGFALGGGCEIAMSCDFRVCSENAVFGQPEVGLGITPGFGGTQRLARLIGAGKAKELIYTGNAIKADEALRIGLVNHIFPQEQLMEEAMKIANKIAKNAPFAVRASKKAINEGLELDIDRAIIIEEKLFGDCFTTEDQKTGMNAFLNKIKNVEFKNK